MRRLLLAKFGFLLGTGVASAQLPAIPQAPPLPGSLPAYPGPTIPVAPDPLPPLSPSLPLRPGQAPVAPPQANSPQHPLAVPQQVQLPQPENKFALNAGDVSLKRVVGGWQLWAGQKVLRDFGDRENDARDVLRVYKDLRPTEWATIGSPRPVVEYALVNGRPPATLGNPGAEDPKNPNSPPPPNGGFGAAVAAASAKFVLPIDLGTVRAEAVRGAWVLRDDYSIHLNFGPVKADAEQAAAVVRRYGFNRVGVVGQPNAPVMSYFFVGQDAGIGAGGDRGPFAKAALQAQIDGLSRVGIPVPGVGYVGEMVRIDPKKFDVRKDGADWVVASGDELIGRFGPSEYAARDAARTMADARFTEFCRVGSAGLTFFLSNGKAPTKVPFHAQGRRFDPSALKVVQQGGKWAVTENGRHMFDCASAEEGETLVRVVKAFGFDQLCHVGPSPRQGVPFFAKGQ